MSFNEIIDGARLVDYFVICGLDFDSGLEPDRYAGDNHHISPLDRSYKGKVLAHYPENLSSNPFDEHAVCMLCLPAGLQFRTQKHLLDPKFHSFVATKENATRYYGFTYTFYEEVRNRNICSAMHTLQAMYITELSSGQTPPSRRKSSSETSRSLPRSFKLTPNTGSSLTYYDITKDKLYVMKCITLISQVPYVRIAETFLINLYKSIPRQPGPGLSPESYVFNILYEVSLPTPGHSLQLYVPPKEQHLPPKPIVIYTPKPPEDLPLLDYPVRELFQYLGVNEVINFFTCVLLEHQVLVRSTDYNKLMLACECITSLLCPFVWPHVYVPVLPGPLHHFLDAPVPFVMGLHSDCYWSNTGPLCLVDIDKAIVKTPEDLPVFPHYKEFIKELNYVLDKYQIEQPVQETNKYGNHGLINKYKAYNIDMTASCTLPSDALRRKHSPCDALDSDERRPLASPQLSPLPQKRAPPLQRIVDIKRTGNNLDESDCETVMPSTRKGVLTEEEQYKEDTKLNTHIREIFLNRFLQMFKSYEVFVVMPDQDRDSWFSARESMTNFDKAAFLSDQPSQSRQFLSRFLETQMFATLIDNKIMSLWGDTDVNLQVFEHRLKLFRQTETSRWYSVWGGLVSSPSPPSNEVCASGERLPHRAAYYRTFPSQLDRAALTPPDRRTSSLKRLKNAKWQVKEADSYLLNERSVHRLSTELTANAIAQNNKTFVDKLLKECKTKTKRMLLEKMGTDEPEMGLSSELTGVEENTMIASLCDLLERLWSHGLQRKVGKSALWQHLLNYQELEQCSSAANPIDPNGLSPDLSSSASTEDTLRRSPSINRSRDSSRAGSRDGSIDRLGSGSNTLERRSNQTVNPLRPLPESLTFDMRNVQAMSDIKTEIGFTRAWVRLALEKKLLSRHFRELLADNTLLRSLYKRNSFLRCEEEREQFLYHLLTLNAVDYLCFTKTYPTTKLPYRVLIVPSKKASATTANCWISISGTNGNSTPKIPIPKNSMEFVFHHKNLGVLSTLRIGHDNSGLSPRWLLDSIFIRNEVTGHTYRFPCSRWLGSGVDDGSTERLLVGIMMKSHSQQTSNNMCIQQEPIQTPTTTHLSSSTIQHMIGDCVNAIVKWHYQSKCDKDASSLSGLLCGENGLVKCLEQAFLCGFKSARIFGKNLFIWDYFVRVRDEFQTSLSEESTSWSGDDCSPYNCRSEYRSVWRCYCHLLDQINNAGQTLGKDGKFQLFICLSLREHWLHRMLLPMSMTRATSEMYEERSFLRKKGLLTFLRQILEPLDEFDIVLENSLTQGI